MGRGEQRLVAVIGIIAVLGLLTDWGGNEVEAPAASPTREAGFIEESAFCPPAPETDVDTMEALASAAGNHDTTVGFEPRGPSKDLGAGAVLVRPIDTAGLTLVGYGAPLVAGAEASFSAPVEGSIAARCSSVASDTWYFPYGSSDLGFNEKIVLYNPFPDEAVAEIVVADETGERVKAGLDSIPISSGGTNIVVLNEKVEAKPFVSTRVETVRGRFIAWRVIFHKTDKGPRGVSMTLGATRTSDTWYFPEGVIGSEGSEAIALANPSDSEAVVNISLVTGDRQIAADDLFGIKVARQTAEIVKLDSIPGLSQKEAAHVSATVTTEDGVGIVAERKLSSDTGDLEGISTEVGSVATSRYWMLTPPAPDPQVDTLAVLNPSKSKTAHFDVVLRTKDGARQPDKLSNVKVRPGLRVQVPLRAVSTSSKTIVVVRADRNVVAERSGRSATDAGTVMGTPIDKKLALLAP